MNEDVRWNPHPHCSLPHDLWSSPDKQATEHEVTEFLAALTRLLKPNVVIETGTYEAHTTRAIARALKRNGRGRILTFETDPDRAKRAEKTLANQPATVHAHELRDADLTEPVDLAFLDSGMRDRETDIRIVWPKLAPGGFVLIHDASPTRPPGQVRPPGRYAMFDFPTPRGLNAFQKPWNA